MLVDKTTNKFLYTNNLVFGNQNPSIGKLSPQPDKFEKQKDNEDEKETKPSLTQKIKDKIDSLGSHDWLTIILCTTAIISAAIMIGQTDGWHNFVQGTKNKIKGIKLPGGKEFGDTQVGQWMFKKSVNTGNLQKINPNPKGIKMDDLVGVHMNEAKKEMLERVEYFKDPENAKKYGIKKMDGILLSGPPGNGKTELVKSLCNENDLTMYSVNCANLGSSYQNQTQQNTKAIFEEVYQLGDSNKKSGKPIVLFLDECDAIFKNRDNIKVSEDNKDAVNAILDTIMHASEHNVMLIGASNKLGNMDAAVIRPGRFKNIILGNPNIDDAGRIFSCKFNKIPKDVVSSELLTSGKIEKIFSEELQKAKVSNHVLSGADLTDMIDSAKKAAWHENGVIDESKIRTFIRQTINTTLYKNSIQQ